MSEKEIKEFKKMQEVFYNMLVHKGNVYCINENNELNMERNQNDKR